MAAKLEYGNVRAAIRLLMSDDTLATPSVESLDKLRQKHPQASVRADDLPHPLQSHVCQLMNLRSDGQCFHSLPALPEVLMACVLSIFATCYSAERPGRGFSRL